MIKERGCEDLNHIRLDLVVHQDDQIRVNGFFKAVADLLVYGMEPNHKPAPDTPLALARIMARMGRIQAQNGILSPYLPLFLLIQTLLIRSTGNDAYNEAWDMMQVVTLQCEVKHLDFWSLAVGWRKLLRFPDVRPHLQIPCSSEDIAHWLRSLRQTYQKMVSSDGHKPKIDSKRVSEVFQVLSENGYYDDDPPTVDLVASSTDDDDLDDEYPDTTDCPWV